MPNGEDTLRTYTVKTLCELTRSGNLHGQGGCDRRVHRAFRKRWSKPAETRGRRLSNNRQSVIICLSKSLPPVRDTLPEPPDTTENDPLSVIPFRRSLSFAEDGKEHGQEHDQQVSHHSAAKEPDEISDSEIDSESDLGVGLESDLDSEMAFQSSLTEVARKRIALVGRFSSMNRREAANVLTSYQAQVVDLPRDPPRDGVHATDASAVDEFPPRDRFADLDWIVIGGDQPPLAQSELLQTPLIEAAARGQIEILRESELWQRIGLVDIETSVRRYHTPAMLADLLNVSVRVIRRWQRRGLITPIVTVHRLPYFDYAEVATAKRLAGWIADGASPVAIERRLAELVEVLPNIRRPLDQLSILVEGKHVLLRQGAGLIEPGGQMRFDFEALDEGLRSDDEEESAEMRNVLAFEIPDQPPMLRAISEGQHEQTEHDPILLAAYEAEDEDDLETAVELYHTVLARDGARADISFQIGELLYRMNFLIGARERYYSAIELDPDFVEARASLGGVLAELGQYELAIAALRGALKMYDDYADVHYTLAKVLDRVDREVEAEMHWQRCWQLSPESPWADEAKERLGL